MLPTGSVCRPDTGVIWGGQGTSFDDLLDKWRELAKGKDDRHNQKLYSLLDLMVSYLEPPPFALRLSSRGIDEPARLGVTFGFWDEGYEWDRCRAASGIWRQENGIPAFSDTKTHPTYFLDIDGIKFTRPSALYKALMFQVFQEMMPVPNAYFCTVCGREYQTGSGTGRRAPRSDKEGHTCLRNDCVRKASAERTARSRKAAG